MVALLRHWCDDMFIVYESRCGWWAVAPETGHKNDFEMNTDNFNIDDDKWRILRLRIVTYIRLLCIFKTVFLLWRIVPMILCPYVLVFVVNTVDILLAIITIVLLLLGLLLHRPLAVKAALITEAVGILVPLIGQVTIYVWLMIDARDFLERQGATEGDEQKYHRLRIIFSAILGVSLIICAIRIWRYAMGDIAKFYTYMHLLFEHERAVEREETRIVAETLDDIAHSIHTRSALSSRHHSFSDSFA